MAREFNITEANRYFLGEDKHLDLQVFGEDDATPLDVTGLPLEWSLKKKDKDPDPPIIGKSTSVGGGITVIGVYNAIPASNTQRVRIAIASDETDPFVTSLLATPYTLKAGVEYRHSLKRRDTGNELVLSFGGITFMQATEP